MFLHKARPEESECGVSECDCEASLMRRPCPTRGYCAMAGKKVFDNILLSSLLTVVWLGISHSIFPAMKLCILRCAWLRRTITSDYARSCGQFRYLLIGLHLTLCYYTLLLATCMWQSLSITVTPF